MPIVEQINLSNLVDGLILCSFILKFFILTFLKFSLYFCAQVGMGIDTDFPIRLWFLITINKLSIQSGLQSNLIWFRYIWGYISVKVFDLSHSFWEGGYAPAKKNKKKFFCSCSQILHFVPQVQISPIPFPLRCHRLFFPPIPTHT